MGICFSLEPGEQQSVPKQYKIYFSRKCVFRFLIRLVKQAYCKR